MDKSMEILECISFFNSNVNTILAPSTQNAMICDFCGKISNKCLKCKQCKGHLTPCAGGAVTCSFCERTRTLDRTMNQNNLNSLQYLYFANRHI